MPTSSSGKDAAQTLLIMVPLRQREPALICFEGVLVVSNEKLDSEQGTSTQLDL
jgi:hypothetical protein